MPTPRDRVWTTVIVLRNRHDGFTAATVYDTMKAVFDDEDVPSRKTIRNTLTAMNELGVLTRVRGSGHVQHAYVSNPSQDDRLIEE